MIYLTIWVITYSIWILFEVGFLHQHTVLALLYRLGRNGKLLKCLRILITVVYFKDRKWVSKTVYCISSLVVSKIAFCSEFPDIPDSAGRKTRRRRKKKNTGSCKALCVSRKRNKSIKLSIKCQMPNFIFPKWLIQSNFGIT